MNALSRLIWPILSAAACLACAQTAMAAEPERTDVPSVKVYYGDLNLQRDEAVASLYRRIERAAERVCERPNERAVQQIYATRKCTETAIERAVASINMPALTRHAARTKASATAATG
jgi:UrcA family protein